MAAKAWFGVVGGCLDEEATETQPWLPQLVHGNFESLLKETWVTDILKTVAEDKYVSNLEAKAQQGEEAVSKILAVGVACLQSFVQVNWTGPTLNLTPIALFEHHNLTNTPLAQLPREKLLQSLVVDGEDAYPLVEVPEFLILAIRILVETLFPVQPFLNSTIPWWAMRCTSIHQKVLENLTNTLKQNINDCAKAAEKQLPEKTEQTKDLWIKFRLERGLNHHLYHDNNRAMECFNAAQEASGFNWKLTGKLGRRLRYQTFDIAQLIVEATSSAPAEEISGGKTVPNEIELNDNDILEKINFTDPTGASSNLQILDQCLLLAFSLNFKRAVANDAHTKEEMSAFVTRVLENPNNWLVHTMGLLLKSHLESDKGKTVERAALQLQALVDQYNDPDPKAIVSHRLRFFYQLIIPSRWKMQKELGERFVSIGALRSAQEIFERLQLWENVIECYQYMEKTKKAEELVRARIEVQPSPKLYCILGDLVVEPIYYEKAWELSQHRYARALRSLAAYYFQRKDIARSIPYFEQALSINPIFARTWFSLGCAYMLENDWEKALTAFVRVVSLEPTDSESWSNIAAIHLKMNRKPDAYRALKEAVKNSYDNWKIWENLLYVSLDLNELAETVQAFHRLIDINESRFDSEAFLFLMKRYASPTQVDNNKQPLSRHRKVVGELLAKIQATLPVDHNIARAEYFYAFSLGDWARALEANNKLYRSLIKDEEYKQDEPKFIAVCECGEDIANIVLEMAEDVSSSADKKSRLEQLYSARSTIKTIKARTKEAFGTHAKQAVLEDYMKKIDQAYERLEQK